MELKVVLEPGEDRYIVAHCPSLKSCWSQGRTREEALRNIREAIELYLEADSYGTKGGATGSVTGACSPLAAPAR